MRGNALDPFGQQIAGRRTAEVPQTENADHPLQYGSCGLSFTRMATMILQDRFLAVVGPAVRPELASPACGRQSGRHAGSARPCAAIGAYERRCNIFVGIELCVPKTSSVLI
jgi:hypothetical protein